MRQKEILFDAGQSRDLERLGDLIRKGFWIKSETPQGCIMRQDFPRGVLSDLDELISVLARSGFYRFMKFGVSADFRVST